MVIKGMEYQIKGMHYMIRSAFPDDAANLSEIRAEIDGETENLDREKGEAFLDETAFRELIRSNTENPKNLFLVAAVNGYIVGFSRCEGNFLKRFSHKAEFGVCILKKYWGYGIGRNFLNESVAWADSNQIRKITLNVLETNIKAMELYKKFGFEVEDVLKQDKRLSDGKYYNTIVMGRIFEG